MKARLPQGMGGQNNMNSVIKQAQKMQEEMEKKQALLDEKIYETSVGGGAVSVSINGKKQVTALTIKPEVVDPEDVEMLQDLIISGINEVIRIAEEDSAEQMNAITGGLNIPGMF